MKTKKQIIIVVAIILISIIALAGTTFAVFTASLTGTKKVSIQTGTLQIDFTEGNRINLTNAAPVTDAKGQEGTPYTFTIENTGNITAYYTVQLNADSANTLDGKWVKYRLTGDNDYDSGVQVVGTQTNGSLQLVPRQSLTVGDTVTYQLYLWLSNDADNSAQGGTYQSKIVVSSQSN